jgi:L-ascorbate metabolism protein UlaG (beta-lactamase superfamily)|tara:strand:+ start:662 stop:1432 length:771 start_codon:yes stop_codon:yes gene_type:complete
MNIRQIRNATLVIEYAGKRFLTDPWFGPKGDFPGFDGTPNSHIRNPTVDLPVPIEELLDVDAVVLTHVHPDHWDDHAARALPKDIPFFVQHPGDREIIKAAGFTDVRMLTGNPEFDGVKLIKTPGQHGSDECVTAIYDLLGEVCGVVFRHLAEPTLYLAGDTVFNDYVAGNLRTFLPDVIVLNCCDAQVVGFGSIIMSKEDVREVYRAAPEARIVASHMEAVNHATLTRAALRAFLAEHEMTDRVLVPEDGETCAL